MISFRFRLLCVTKVSVIILSFLFTMPVKTLLFVIPVAQKIESPLTISLESIFYLNQQYQIF